MFGSVHFQRLGAAFSLAFVVFQVFDLFRPTELYSSKIGTVKTHAGPCSFLRSAWREIAEAIGWNRLFHQPN